MSVLFAGGRAECFQNTSGASPSHITNTSAFDSNYSDAGLATNGWLFHQLYDSMMNPTIITSGNTLWWHGLSGGQATSGANLYQFNVVLYDSSGYPWFGIFASSGTGAFNYTLSYNNGTGASPNWTQLGIFYGNGLFAIDFAVTIGATGNHTYSFYINGSVLTIGPGTFTATGFTNVASIQYNVSGNGNGCVSQVIVTSNQPTLNMNLKTCRATAAGALQQWTGNYTNVNAPSGPGSNYDQSTTAGQTQLYTMGNIALPTGYQVLSVFHWLSVKNTGTAPNNIQSACYRNGTQYASSNLSGVGLAFSAVGYRYDADPSTGNTWSQLGWNAPVQLGYESAT